MTERPDAAAAPLDYWGFVALAQARIPAEVPDAHLAANRLILSLNRAASAVTYDLEASIHRPRGLSWAAFRLLFVLWVAGPSSSHVAARLCGMTRASVSNLSQPLVERGLLTKDADPSDGRSLTLRLTDAGRALVRETFVQQNAREADWASVLTPDEGQVLVTLLEKLMAGRRDIGAARRH